MNYLIGSGLVVAGVYWLLKDKHNASSKAREKGKTLKLRPSRLKRYVKLTQKRTSEDLKVQIAESEALERSLMKLVEFIVRDYVEWWYHPISKNSSFPKDLRHLLKYFLARLVAGIKEVEWETLMQEFIIELRKLMKTYRVTEIELERRHPEFKTFDLYQKQGLILQEIYTNYELHVAVVGNHKVYLRKLSMAVLEDSLKQTDLSCRPLVSLFREIIACKVLDSVMWYANAHYINSSLVTACEKASSAGIEVDASGYNEPKLRSDSLIIDDGLEAEINPELQAKDDGHRKPPSLEPSMVSGSRSSSALTPPLQPTPAPRKFRVDGEDLISSAPERTSALAGESDRTDELFKYRDNSKGKLQAWFGEDNITPTSRLEAQSPGVGTDAERAVSEGKRSREQGDAKKIGIIGTGNHSKTGIGSKETGPSESQSKISVLGATHATPDIEEEHKAVKGRGIRGKLEPQQRMTGARQSSAKPEGRAYRGDSGDDWGFLRRQRERSSLGSISSTGRLDENGPRPSFLDPYATGVTLTPERGETKFTLTIVDVIKVEGPKPHVRYKIHCRNGRYMTWAVEKRYKEFHELNKILTKELQNRSETRWASSFPRKSLLSALGNTFDRDFLHQRREQLQNYLNACCNDPQVLSTAHFRAFIIPTSSQAEGTNKSNVTQAGVLRTTLEEKDPKRAKLRKELMVHIYGIVDEIFDLTRHGWLNKQVVWTAKQLLGVFYNSSMYRTIEATMSKYTSEDALIKAAEGLSGR